MTENVDKMTENVDKMTENVDKMTENVDLILPRLTAPVGQVRSISDVYIWMSAI
jgi:hypothetical protein